jgi:hypothetical protein
VRGQKEEESQAIDFTRAEEGERWGGRGGGRRTHRGGESMASQVHQYLKGNKGDTMCVTAKKLDKLIEMERLLKRLKLPKLCEEEMQKCNTHTT